MATRHQRSRISIQLKAEVYDDLKSISEQQGLAMSTVAMQMITQNVKLYKQMYDIMSDPIKLGELSKAMGMLESKE